MKTLKREEVYANRYNNLEQLRTNIEEFTEEYYNRQRLHSALGYRSPEEFEQQSERGHSADSLGATVQFIVDDGNGENEQRASTGLSGEGTHPSPSPALARRCKDVEIKPETVPKVFVTVEGVTSEFCVQVVYKKAGLKGLK